MNKTSVLILFSIIGFLLFNSCRQCNQPVAPVAVQNDTTPNAKLTELSAEIKKDSLNPFLYYKRAHIYEANNDLKNATADMFVAFTLDSVRPEFYLYAANLFSKMGEPKRGIALMNKAIVTDSMNTDYYVKAAELAYIDTTIKGNYLLSLNYLNAAIEKNPQNADIYFFKGNVYKALGDTLKAISAFQTATELNPKHYDAFVQLGLLLNNRRDKNAEKYLNNAIKVGKKPEDALYAKANIYKDEALRLLSLQQTDKSIEKFNVAIENFKKVIEVNYRNAEAYMGLGKCYYEMDSVEQAYKYYGLAAKIAPTYAGAYFSEGLCAEELGRTKEAIELYKSCLNIDPKFTRATEHLKKLEATPPQ